MSGEIRWDMSREEYDRTEAVNFSLLKLMASAPAKYLAAKNGLKKSSKAKTRGSAVHVATLEPKRFLEEYAIYTGERRAGKDWESFKAANAGREILTCAEADEAEAIAKAVRADPTAAKYLSAGRAEASILWECAGHKMKSRLDWVADCGAVVDLKSTRDASPEGFGREVTNYRTHMQAAMYQDAAKAALGQALPVVLIAVEAEAPHVVQCYRVPEWLLEAGRVEYRRLLEQLEWCEAQGEFPGYGNGEMDLTLPDWAARKMEEVLNG